MLKLSKSSNADQALSLAINLIGAGTTIRGELEAAGDLRIDGAVLGEVRSQGKLVLGEGARIEGDVHCGNADLSGEVLGNIFIRETLTLKSTARVTGDLHAQKLIIEGGAEFNGQCHMGKEAEAITNANAGRTEAKAAA